MIGTMITASLKRVLPALILFASLCGPVHAGHDRWMRPPDTGQGFAPQTAADRRISLAQAIEAVQRATGGKVLDAKDLGSQYRIKVLTRNGEVRVVLVDAETGAMH
jgi:uncharacterized membrane protein YkoI